MRLKDKVAMVTGAGAGIGREVAVTLAREGADVVVNDVDPEAAARTCEEIRALGRRAMPAPADVSDYKSVEAVVADAIRTFGRIDILVNNAGYVDAHEGRPEDLDLSEWNRMLAVSLTGVFICSQLVGREMIKRKSGKIVSISSSAGLSALPNSAAYTAVKHGVVGLTKSLAIEWGKHGINVNCVAPGSTLTARAEKYFNADPEALADRASRVPLGRLAKPQDQARVVAFLASADADYISGQVIVVDGGTHALYAGFAPPK
jgi:NAD(P)-dependent dehydrogenase (short-subunit alcohol dehydrogenase family)